MDEIRSSSSSSTRRLSQILDPITRLASDFGSNSAPCSPRLGARVHDAGSQSGPAAGGVSSSSRAGPSGTASTGGSNSGPDSPRLWPRQFRQAPTPPPRPRHVVTTSAGVSTVSIATSTSSVNINNNNNNNNAGSGADGDAPSSAVIHARDSPYVNVPNLFFHKDKSFAESVRGAGYIELREKPKCSPYDFTSEPSGHVEYADKRTFVTPVQSDLAYDVGKEPGSPLCRGRSNYDPGPSSGRGHFDRAFSFSGRQPSEQPPVTRMYETGRLFVDPRTAGGSVDIKREKLDVRPSYVTSKSFDGYTTTVEELNWQERCLELQLELHRSRSQATRVRDMLREKLSELEQRVLEAEGRADEAEDKVRMMEERLVKGEYCLSTSGVGSPPHSLPSTSGTQNDKIEDVHCACISKLETQVEEQRQLRLQDARQVEAKAARIKEWVTNKLRELEQQNQHLREQNNKCNQQLELLRNHITNIGLKPPAPTRASLSLEVDPTLRIDRRRSESLEGTPQTVPECVQNIVAEPQSTSTKHRRHLSACGTIQRGIAASNMDSSLLSDELAAAVENLVMLPNMSGVSEASRDSGSSEAVHDYAEIYTPSREGMNWLQGSGQGPRPPTPPLHRFPSWEAKIYQVADGGLGIGPPTNEESAPSTMTNTSSSKHSQATGHNLTAHNSQGYCDISVPVYATVKGRASQIRSMPFGDSSDDSSDGEEHPNQTETNTRITNSSSDNTDSSLGSGSSPSKSIKTTSSLSPAKRSSSGSPSKSVKRDTSLESGLSEDYAIPPDALSSTSLESSMPSLLMRVSGESPKRQESLEKTGHLAKLGGKLKTWRKRWFVLKNGVLTYWKSQNDVNRKPQGQIILDEVCRINRAEGAATFEIATGKKTYYLTADCIATMEDWIRVLQNVQRRNATKLLLSKEDNKPTIQGWLTKVKNGHAKKCWCVLIGKMFLYFKCPSDTNPIGQINMRDARVEEVEHVSDSDSEERDAECPHERTIGIFPTHQGPTYLLMPHKQDKDNWLYHLTVVSGGGPSAGTQYEQLVQRLMETDGDPSCVLWRHPLLLHTKESITSPLTSLTSESLQTEAIKLFKACQLFMSVAVEQAGIDYHVVLAQNALQQCLDQPELQSEFICALVKQTSRHTQHRLGVQGHSTSTILDCKTNPAQYVLIQGWQLLALAVSLFLPRNNRLLWYLKLHLQRNADSKTECGKYAAYCERALERTLQNGGREVKPSRMEVLSILMKNPYHHSLPHAIPVHFLNGTYQVVSFDGSTTIEEFLNTLNQEIGCRDVHQSGFTLFSDDPIEKDLEHFIDLQAKLCDIISKWETALREKGSGKFENTRVIQLTYKSRCYWRQAAKMETDKERLLLCYQVNQQVVQGKFPLNRDLAFELASLMAQIDFGEYNNDKARGSGPGSNPHHLVLQALDKFYPIRYRTNITPDQLRELQEKLQEKWIGLKGRSVLDCVRIYLTCTRKWPFFGATLYQAKLKQTDPVTVWIAVCEDSVTLLELQTMAVMCRYNYANIVTFGGCLDDFMLVACPDEGAAEQKLLFALSKPKILEITLLIADYMNALGHALPGTPQMNTLTRNGSHRSIKSTLRPATGSSCLPTQPDILKSTPDHQRP
ncbi:PH domain-containing protein [Camponotus japonicus]